MTYFFLRFFVITALLLSPAHAQTILSNSHFKVTLDDSVQWNNEGSKEVVSKVLNYWSSILDYAPTDNKVTVSLAWEALGDNTIGYNNPAAHTANGTLPNGMPYNLMTQAEARLKGGLTNLAEPFDMLIVFSSDYAFSYTDIADPNKMDFQSILLHEMGHGMGFMDNAEETGWPDNSYTAWDMLMNINHADYTPGMEISIGDPALGAYVYNPNLWEEGSSMGHLTPESDPYAVMLAERDYGEIRRTFTNKELALFSQMGWNLARIPEPSSVLLLFLSTPALIWRRKRAA